MKTLNEYVLILSELRFILCRYFWKYFVPMISQCYLHEKNIYVSTYAHIYMYVSHNNKISEETTTVHCNHLILQKVCLNRIIKFIQ